MKQDKYVPNRSTYKPLAEYLQKQTGPQVTLTFQQIEQILGRKLPASARDHTAFWSNSYGSTTHTWATLWMQVGWKAKPKLRAQQILFINVSKESAVQAALTDGVAIRPEEGNTDDASEAGQYEPCAGDGRRVVERQIKERRGQQAFRDAVRDRYQDRCLVTGCTLLAVLEAAHIKPYRMQADNDPTNGLLLRSDIHTLFDLDLLGIEPVNLTVELHPSVVAEYGSIAGTRLRCEGRLKPSTSALKLRYAQFCKRKLYSL